jgi:hypothetical protein
METKSKSDGAGGAVTRDEKLTLEKNVKPDGNTETTKDVKSSHKGRARTIHRTHVVEKTVRDAQGNELSHEKSLK